MFRKYLYSNFGSEQERARKVASKRESAKKRTNHEIQYERSFYSKMLTSESTFGKQTHSHTQTHTHFTVFGLKKRDENKTSNKLHLEIFTFYLIACRWHL